MSGSAPDTYAWMDEIVLDPAQSWLAMGTRSLGTQPWLIVDADDNRRRQELALRRSLLDERADDVLAAPPESRPAADELLAMVEADSPLRIEGSSTDEPLLRLGRSVQEDFCLLRRGHTRWELAAAVLCFPSRWRLADKLGRPLTDVHGPVAGYDSDLADRVTSLLDRMGDRIVRRRNWFLHPDPSLFQPERRPDPIIDAARVETHLFLRSERQTVRRLPETGWVVFTIRTEQEPLGVFLADDERRRRFVEYLDGAAPDELAHRGASAEQRCQMRSVLSGP